MDTFVVDAVRWRASLPAAVGARLACSEEVDWEATTAVLGGATHLDLQYCDYVPDNVLLRLPTSLRDLDVRDCERLTTHASFAHLTALASLDCSQTAVVRGRADRLPPSLQELNINHVSFAPDGVSFAHLSQLQVLRANESKIDAVTLASLPPCLEELQLAGCYDLPPAASFAHLTALRVLDDTHSAMSDASLASVPPNLLFLHARECHKLTSAATLPHLPALQLLDVGHTAIGDALVASLPASLVELRLAGCWCVTAGATLDHVHALRLLHCSSTKLAPAVLDACRARGCAVPAISVLRWHTSCVGTLAVLGDGQLASREIGHAVRLWDVAGEGKVTAILEANDPARAMAALPDGRRLAIGTGTWNAVEGCIEVWDVGGVPPACCATIICRSGVRELAALPDGRLAVGGDGREVLVVDVDAGAVVMTLSGHKGRVGALAVLPNGALASGSADTSVRVWDVAARKCVARLKGHTSEVRSLTVLPDGRLVSVGVRVSDAVRLWDVGKRACVGVLNESTIWVTALAALPDGRLATASTKGAIHVWDTRPAAAAGDSRAAGDVPVEVAGVLSGSVLAMLSLPDGRLACGGGHTRGTVCLLEVPPPAAVDE